MGGMHQRDPADTTHNVREICVSLFVRCSFSRRCRWREPPPYDPAADDTQRPASTPFTDGALDNAGRARNSFPFVHRPNTLDRDRIVVPAGGIAQQFRRKSGGEAWEHDLLFDARIDSDSNSGAREMYASLVQDQGPSVVSHSHDAADGVSWQCSGRHSTSCTNTRSVTYLFSPPMARSEALRYQCTHSHWFSS